MVDLRPRWHVRKAPARSAVARSQGIGRPVAEAEPDRLPPPPFWRTRYFENSVMKRADRRVIEPGMIVSLLGNPQKTERDTNGRMRFWGWVPELERWLRVVTLKDGETVHTAFLDRDFQP